MALNQWFLKKVFFFLLFHRHQANYRSRVFAFCRGLLVSLNKLNVCFMHLGNLTTNLTRGQSSHCLKRPLVCNYYLANRAFQLL